MGCRAGQISWQPVVLPVVKNAQPEQARVGLRALQLISATWTMTCGSNAEGNLAPHTKRQNQLRTLYALTTAWKGGMRSSKLCEQVLLKVHLSSRKFTGDL